ncbi:MAG: bifunctional methylenetetrahydrofolate dehydrogenase/methenyltetrahydrofolate cyclohydrolase FolD [Pseudomonadota bacterium]
MAAAPQPTGRSDIIIDGIIDGKAVAADITAHIATGSARFVEKAGRAPGLAVVLVGDDPASAVYVRNKGKTATRLGFYSVQETLAADIDQKTLADTVRQLNDDDRVDGILVQMPLPSPLDAEAIIDLIDPQKDVDGFHPVNVGRLAAGARAPCLVPCTPAGSVRLAKAALGDDLSGKHAVIVGRSTIVGRPAAQLFLAENCTVTIAHSRTEDLPAVTRTADILIAAVGRAGLIGAEHVKPGACVIDVGINRIAAPEKGPDATKLVGDVDFATVAPIAGAITPVPGGVGPMTIAMLMHNTLTAACRRAGFTDIDF